MLNKRTCEVLKDNKMVSASKVSPESGTLYFEGSRDEYTVRITMTPAMAGSRGRRVGSGEILNIL